MALTSSSGFGSILAGTMFMFGGPLFMHVYAGHLPHICVIPWIPLILLAIDGIIETNNLGFGLLGIVAVAMQIFAGHLGFDGSIGEKFLQSKNEYFATMGVYGPYDEKALEEMTFYGLPFWQVRPGFRIRSTPSVNAMAAFSTISHPE